MKVSNIDKLKIDLLNDLEYFGNKIALVCSFSTDELKLDYLSKNDGLSMDAKVKIIASLDNDHKKLEILRELKNDSHADKETVTNILGSIHDDKLKYKYMNMYYNLINKEILVSTFKSDNYKLNYLDNNEVDIVKKYNILKTLTDDEYKKSYILSNSLLLSGDAEEFAFTEFLASIHDDNFKKPYLTNKSISKPFNIRMLIMSLDSDDNKLDYLRMFDTQYTKVDFITSISSDNLKDSLLAKIDNPYYRYGIIASFKDDKYKIKYLEEVEEENYRTKIIRSMSNNELKLKYLDKIKMENNRVSILLSLDNEKEKSDMEDAEIIDDLNNSPEQIVDDDFYSDSEPEIIDYYGDDNNTPTDETEITYDSVDEISKPSNLILDPESLDKIENLDVFSDSELETIDSELDRVLELKREEVKQYRRKILLTSIKEKQQELSKINEEIKTYKKY